MIQTAEQEAEQSIDEAFNEGYKQGLLASAPDAEYWRIKSLQHETEIARLKKEKCLGAGFLAGSGFGFTIRIQN